MNSGFYKDLDTNFEQALILCDKNFSHSELIELLKNGNIPQKQIAALNFDKVDDQSDVEVLMHNLTGQDGKIREAVALKINNLVNVSKKAKKLFATDNNAKIFALATIDINGNICRYIVDTIVELIQYDVFISIYAKYITDFAIQALDEIDKFVFRDKKYVINKQIFKLYWCLEAIKYIYKHIEKVKLSRILKRSMDQSEYTIREKVAQIVVLDDSLYAFKDVLKNDSNYYVRAVFKS